MDERIGLDDVPSIADEAWMSANGSNDDYEPPDPTPLLRVVTLEDFAAVHEASADPLLGDKDNNLIAAGAISVVYGDGGAGKTTLFLDVAMHMATQTDWVNLQVPTRSRILWIENEGPRGMFRQKTEEKNRAWAGPPVDGHFHVLEEPWSLFTFLQPRHRHELAEHVDRLGINMVVAGPVQRLGVQGGGTPAEVGKFIELVEETRAELAQPLAFTFIHHENKSGEVSGAWEGIPDTLIHVYPQGNGKTRLHWQKARWAPDVHGKTWHLLWQPGSTFTMDETPENTDEDIRMSILEAVRLNPGLNWNKIEAKVVGKGDRKRHVRDQMIVSGDIENAAKSARSMALYAPGTGPRPGGTQTGTQGRDGAEERTASRVPTYKEGQGTQSLPLDAHEDADRVPEDHLPF